MSQVCTGSKTQVSEREAIQHKKSAPVGAARCARAQVWAGLASDGSARCWRNISWYLAVISRTKSSWFGTPRTMFATYALYRAEAYRQARCTCVAFTRL